MSSIESLSSTQMVSNLQVAAQAKQTATTPGAIQKPAPPPQPQVTQTEAPDSPRQQQAGTYQGRASLNETQARNEPVQTPNSTFSLLA